MEELQAQRAAAEEAGRQVSQSAGTLQAELEALRQKEAVETASAAEARALLSALAAAAQELLDRDEAVRQELAEGEQKLSVTREEAARAGKELAKAREDRDSLLNIISGYTMRLDSREKKARAAEEAHVKLQMEENAVASRIHMLAEMEKLYEGYSKAVKLVMGEAERGNLKHIHGPVAGLIHVPDRYAVAVEIALGGAMQHVVVDSEADGKAAIQYLKRRDGGRCTFLPLNTIRPSDFRERSAAQEPGFVGLGDELVEFDPRYAKIISNLLGRTVSRRIWTPPSPWPGNTATVSRSSPGRPGPEPRRLHDRRLGVPQRGDPVQGQRAGTASDPERGPPGPAGGGPAGGGGGAAGAHRRRL
jgi:chromosome segregation protein